VISHYGFDLHFSDDQLCWAFLHMSVDHLYIFLGKMSIQIFYPSLNRIVFLSFFFFLTLSYMSCVHILDIYPLLVIPFANIFSHLVGFLFCPQFPLLCKAVMFN